MKKFTAIGLILALILSFSGCGYTALQQVYEKTTGETLSEGHVEEKTFNYPEKTTTTFADGTSTGTKRLYKDAVDKDRLVIKHCVGIIYYENEAETHREDWELDENGNPLTITSSQGSLTTYTYVYDDQGRVTEKTCTLDGQQDHTITYTYDESGNILTENFRGGYTKTTEYTYDDQDRVTEVLVVINDQPDSRTVTEYADNGRKSSVTYYDGEDAITGWEEYTHDGSYETVWVYDGDGNRLYRWEHTYSSEDLLARKIVYSSDDTLISTTLYTYIGIRNAYLVYD